jgi:adenosyl cobinamide kinase/adenosyl cobinamide phosphate guanylyltransferase
LEVCISHTEKEEMAGYQRPIIPERVEFVLRKLEDMKILEHAHQSTSKAVSLSDVSHKISLVQSMMKKIHHTLLNSEANWEEVYSNAKNWMTELIDLSKCIEKAIFIFLEEVESTVKAADKRISRKPVNFFALHKFDIEMSDIERRLRKIHDDAGRYGISIPGNRPEGGAVTNLQTAWSTPFRSSYTMELVGLESQKNYITKRLLQNKPGHSVIAIVGNQGSGKSLIAENIYQRLVQFHDHTIYHINSRNIEKRSAPVSQK